MSGLEDDSIVYAEQLINAKHHSVKISSEKLKNVCVNIEGHPLAIQLAVQLLDYGESPDDILQTIVSMKSRGEELSKRLLNEIFTHPKSTKSEKNFMLNFSVFRRPVSKKAVYAIVGTEDTTSTLHTLIDKFMITHSEGLYATHPLIREFCYKRLKNKDQVHEKRADYLKNERTDSFDSVLEEDIFHHLERAENYQECADLITEKGELFILTGNTNSLKQMLYTVSSKGVERPEFLLFNGNIAQIKGEWDDALAYFQKASSSLEKNEKVRAGGLIRYGEMLHLRGNIKESLVYFEQGCEMCRHIDYQKYEAGAINDIGMANLTFGNLDFALEKFKESLKIRQEIGDKQGIAVSLNDIGSIFKIKGKLNDALEKFKESLKVEYEIGNKQGIAISLNNIGSILQDKGNLNGALEKYNESLKIYEEIGDKQRIATSLNNIGSIFRAKGNLNGALAKYKESLKIRKETGDKKGIIYNYNNIGTVCTDQKDYSQALQYFFKSQALQNQTGINVTETKKNINGIRKILGLKRLEELANDTYAKLSEELKPYLNLEEVFSDATIRRETPKVRRNAPCPCGSGKKYKQCCEKEM
ncbi:MAG: tetratricopeptide repeat protein [Desulfobacterales bacterium]|nr:tetratricopeptide repeat protein [Desulfobacterales bacterium]